MRVLPCNNATALRQQEGLAEKRPAAPGALRMAVMTHCPCLRAADVPR
jgi:hypothetical protein